MAVSRPKRWKIIEVGACWATPDGRALDRFQSFVRPTERPTLTPFCKGLTNIEQSDIDGAPTWRHVSAMLAEFATRPEQAGGVWGSWGSYDALQIQRDCARHGVPNPLAGLVHQNLKANFAKSRKIKQVGVVTALRIIGLPLEGVHHRGLDDALSIARLLPWSWRGRP
ncbi:3'-5' exonuclease [Achromobacter aloeverae]|uniref:3'-5' exonuclease n=1 Tax=Achromobacter aloeverae TaxID=1750518 RepID=UPI001F026568|nr:3'-5' exonuclease [Achromobacter aloeverae]